MNNERARRLCEDRRLGGWRTEGLEGDEVDWMQSGGYDGNGGGKEAYGRVEEIGARWLDFDRRKERQTRLETLFSVEGSTEPPRRLTVCMYGHTYSKSMDQPGKVDNPARGQLNRKTNIFMSAFAPENLFSRDGIGSPVPRQPAHLHTQAKSGAYRKGRSKRPNQSKRPGALETAKTRKKLSKRPEAP